MNRHLPWLLLAASMLLSACGFHLKGLGGPIRPLPFASVYLESANSGLGQKLHNELSRNDKLVITDAPKQAEAIISVVNERQSKDVSTINTGGKVNEYMLTYTAVIHTVIAGEAIEPDMQVTVRRTMNYSDSDVLGKEQEEAQLWEDARRDAAEQIARRLSYIKRPAGLGPTGPQSLKPGNASNQP